MLDYRTGRPSVNGQGLLWLAAGLSVLVSVGMYYVELVQGIEQYGGRIETLRSFVSRNVQGEKQAAGDAKLLQAEMKEAKAVLRRLSVPWDEFFRALEEATRRHAEGIRVIDVQPDAEKGHVVINGESKDFDVLLDYVVQLGQDDILRHVRLVNHQIQREAPGKPVRFSVVAEWRAGS